MHLCVKILVNTLFLSGLIVQGNISMALNLVLTEMFTVTEKSAVFKKSDFWRAPTRYHIIMCP